MAKKIVIYGAGKRGREFFDFLKSENLSNYICCFCDKNADSIGEINGIPVISLQLAKLKRQCFWVSIADEDINEVVTKDLKASNCIVYKDITHALSFCGYNIDKTEFNRRHCAFCHDYHYGIDYFNEAEDKASLDIFWNSNSVFFNMFKMLDLSNVIELACGHGRHVAKYIDNAGHITLIDILQNNINYCKQQYKNYDNISYYKNNGYNLQKLNDNAYSSLFVYDAMVHFEMFDICEYLKDIYRVLKPGALALFHHSNNYNAHVSFSSTDGARNFMSQELFKYLAFQAGFEVVKQEVIDWVKKDLDCVSLLRKP